MTPVTYARRQGWWQRHWRTVAAVVLAASTFAAGWCVGSMKPGASSAALLDPTVGQWNLPALSAPQQQALDDAFAALKTGHYDYARQRFTELLKQQRLWTCLHADLACVAVAQHDTATLQSLVEQGQRDGSLSAADGKALQAMALVKPGTFKAADALFAEAAAADPSRADIFDQWGDCLLRWGKPAEAIAKYRAALLRSNFPVMDDLYRTKIVLAQIQAGQDTPESGLGARIDRALAAPDPTNTALFAGAARAMKAERFADAAALLARARKVSAPSMFRALLYNPCFAQDSLRRELRPLFLAADAPDPLGGE